MIFYKKTTKRRPLVLVGAPFPICRAPLSR